MAHGKVHDSAAVGYQSGAAVYETGRPDYPAAVGDWLHDFVGLAPGRCALEAGAGAGAFTARLTATGARIVAMEPVAAMRLRLARRAPVAAIVGGMADAVPLRAASMDAVVCAQAFHWFATAGALAEFQRVLVPDGTLALVWNVRDETVPWVARLSALTDAYEGDTPRVKTGRWRQAFAGSGFVETDHREVSHAHVGTVDQVVVARTMSVSFVAALPHEQRAALEARLRRFIDEEPDLAGQASVSFPYRTEMYAYRSAPGGRRNRPSSQ